MSKGKKLHKVATVRVGTECFIVHKDKILMHKRSKKKKYFPNCWVIPGGHVDESEDPLTAATREVYEETGVRIDNQHIRLKVCAINHHEDKDIIMMMFIFRIDLEDFQECRGSSEGEAEWISIENVKTMKKIFKPITFYFDHILNDKP